MSSDLKKTFWSSISLTIPSIFWIKPLVASLVPSSFNHSSRIHSASSLKAFSTFTPFSIYFYFSWILTSWTYFLFDCSCVTSNFLTRFDNLFSYLFANLNSYASFMFSYLVKWSKSRSLFTFSSLLLRFFVAS